MILKRRQGLTTVEFALVSLLFFTVLFSAMQFALLFGKRSILINATVIGAHKLAALRPYMQDSAGNPVTTGWTPCAKTMTAIRSALDGKLASQSALTTAISNGTLLVTMSVRTPYTATKPCSSNCSTGTCESGTQVCVTSCTGTNSACNNETNCSIALTTASTQPGTSARASLRYNITPLFSRIGATNWTSLNASMTEIVQ